MLAIVPYWTCLSYPITSTFASTCFG